MSKLSKILSIIGYETERQQLDFVKLMAFRKCFNKPLQLTIEPDKEPTLKQKRQKERTDIVIAIRNTMKLQGEKLADIYPAHDVDIICDEEAKQLLDIEFSSTADSFDWLLNITQMTFLRDSFDNEGISEKQSESRIYRWNLIDSKAIDDIKDPNSLDFKLLQIAKSLNLIDEVRYPQGSSVEHVVIHGCIDRYAKERIHFLPQWFSGFLYYLTNPRGLFNDEESLSMMLARAFKSPHTVIQAILDKHTDPKDPLKWTQNLSGLKREILLAVKKTEWPSIRTSWYTHSPTVYDQQSEIEKRESLKDWPVAMDMIQYYSEQHFGAVHVDEKMMLQAVLATGKDGRIANTEDKILAWHERYGKDLCRRSPWKPLIIFVSDNLTHSLAYQDAVVKAILPDSYDILTIGPKATSFSLAMATDALTKRIYTLSRMVKKQLQVEAKPSTTGLFATAIEASDATKPTATARPLK